MTIVNDLIKPSPLMQAILPQLSNMRIAYEGGTAFKRLVLTKKASESPVLYQDKLLNVSNLPICKSMIGELNDIIFDEDPTRTLAFLNGIDQPIATPLWFEDFLENSDMQDNEFTDVMEKVASMAAVEGWCWIVCDLPENPNPKNRPYLTVIPAQHVVDWKVYEEDGIVTLTYVKIMEYKDNDLMRYKIWSRGQPAMIDDEGNSLPETPTTAIAYEIPCVAGVPSVATVEPCDYFEFPSTYPIPIIQAMPNKDTQNNMIGISDLTDIADLQREWLRLESEAYDSIRFSKPIIRVTGATKVPAGGGGIVRGEKDSVEVFAIPVMDVQQIREQQNGLITQFDGFTGRAGTRNVAETIQSGVSIVEERKALHKKAQTRARTLEKVEQAILNMVCYMMNVQWVGDIEYNSDYESRDTQYKLLSLIHI